MRITAYQLASRFTGLGELAGDSDHPLILAMLKLDQSWPEHDEVPWCSAFVNFVAMLLDLPRSKSLAARSWLTIGSEVPDLGMAKPEFDLVVLSRGSNPMQGHVGFYSGRSTGVVEVLGGNQGNRVSIASFPAGRILSIRRLWQEGG